MRINRLVFAQLAARLAARLASTSGALALAFELASCAHAPPPVVAPCDKPEPLRLALSASERLNPDDKGAPLATVIRLYQLKGVDKLALASFDDLLDHDHDALGDELAAVQELTINPGERVAPPLVRNPDATYLVAVALFRRPTALTWRAVKKLAAPDPQHCHIKDPAAVSRATIALALDENRIEVR
jgi:type VI secretion system protein VasD